MNYKKDKHEVQELKTIRHQMHVCNDYDEYVKLAREIDFDLFGLDVYIPEYIECNNNDCDGACSRCVEMEKEWLNDNKEEINTEIENYLNEYDEINGTELAPTGCARHDWVMNYR